MKILGIETSCDETAVCVMEAEGNIQNPSFKVLGDALNSQIKIHAEYGGVFPAIAKREHAKNLVPLLRKALGEAKKIFPQPPLEKEGEEKLAPFPPYARGDRGEMRLDNLQKILTREPGLFEATKEFLETTNKPDIDFISVTAGPGLEPALWVGINFAIALGEAWGIPVLPSNHMEGHIASPLLSNHPPTSITPASGHPSYKQEGMKIEFPALALLISGGHTELVLAKKWLSYEVIGKTKDDAVGEAFDKVARILGLPYPGGPEISKLAEKARASLSTLSRGEMSEGQRGAIKFPRPMLRTDDFNFSFSGLKTAVLYAAKKEGDLNDQTKKAFALEFEDAVTEVLITKTKKALEQYEIKTLILGGGVTANRHIRESFEKMIGDYPDTNLLIPDPKHSTDNALMIAVAGYINWLGGKRGEKNFVAEGNLSL